MKKFTAILLLATGLGVPCSAQIPPDEGVSEETSTGPRFTTTDIMWLVSLGFGIAQDPYVQKGVKKGAIGIGKGLKFMFRGFKKAPKQPEPKVAPDAGILV